MHRIAWSKNRIRLPGQPLSYYVIVLTSSFVRLKCNPSGKENKDSASRGKGKSSCSSTGHVSRTLTTIMRGIHQSIYEKIE